MFLLLFLSLALPIYKFIFALCKTMFSICVSSLKTEQQQKYRSYIHMPLLPQCHFTITLLSSRLIGSPLESVLICCLLLPNGDGWNVANVNVLLWSWVESNVKLSCTATCSASLQHLCTWHSVDNVIILATVSTLGDRETEVTQNHAQF